MQIAGREPVLNHLFSVFARSLRCFRTEFGQMSRKPPKPPKSDLFPGFTFLGFLPELLKLTYRINSIVQRRLGVSSQQASSMTHQLRNKNVGYSRGAQAACKGRTNIIDREIRKLGRFEGGPPRSADAHQMLRVIGRGRKHKW